MRRWFFIVLANMISSVDLSYNLGFRVSWVKPSNCFRLHLRHWFRNTH